MAQGMGSGRLPTPLTEEAKAWMTAQLESFNGWDLNAAGLGRALYIVAAFVFFAVVFFEQYSKRKERLAKLPPGPFQWPYLGSLPYLLLTAGVRSSSRLREIVAALVTKHGPLMLVQIANTQVLVVSSGEFAKEVSRIPLQLFPLESLSALLLGKIHTHHRGLGFRDHMCIYIAQTLGLR